MFGISMFGISTFGISQIVSLTYNSIPRTLSTIEVRVLFSFNKIFMYTFRYMTAGQFKLNRDFPQGGEEIPLAPFSSSTARIRRAQALSATQAGSPRL